MIASFKAIFFDAGGTLFHPYPSVGQIYQEVARRYGCVANAQFLQKTFHDLWHKKDGLGSLVSHSNEKVEKQWWRELVQEVFSGIEGVTDFDAFFEELYDVFARPEVWHLYPETIEVLQELKKRRKCVGIVSNWDSRLFKLCEGLGLDGYFDFVLASAVFGAAKPSPRIFQEALRRAGVKPREAIHIGDSLEDDIRGAEAVGIQSILIDRSLTGRSLEHLGRKVPKIVRSLSEII